MDEDGVWQDWKDVYINWDTFDLFELRAGRYKMPFGFEQNLGRTEIDFIYRSRISTQLTPARDKGVTASGRFFGRGLSYEVGLFNTDGDIGKLTRSSSRRTRRTTSVPPSPAASPPPFPAVRRRERRPSVPSCRASRTRTATCPKGSTASGVRPPTATTTSSRSTSRDAGSGSGWSWTGPRAASACAPSGCSRARIDSARVSATPTCRTSSARAGTCRGRGWSPGRTRTTTSACAAPS